jgi:hypothetical protein
MRKIKSLGRKKILLFCFIGGFTFLAGITIWFVLSFIMEGKSPVVEEWETANQTFKIRVERRKELFVFLPGSFYKFQSAPLHENLWSEIVTAYEKDSYRIPRDQIRFVNENVGYFFIHSTYAVTVNKGQTWSIYDLKKDVSYKCQYTRIDDVKMSADGIGEIIIYANYKDRKTTPKIHTSDYGQHWTVEETFQRCPLSR